MYLRYLKTSIILILSLMSYTAVSNIPSKVYGYWQPLPRADLFPSVPPFAGLGTPLQQTTAEYNPDVWCHDQGNGYRIPKASDMSESFTNVTTPNAKANNDEVKSVRGPSLALYNEWGDVSRFEGSGWDTAETRFWVAEPADELNRNSYDPKTGQLIKNPAAERMHVACVAEIK